MLQLTAIGRLTKDPEIKTSKAGKELVVFDIAVNKGYGEKKTTTYVSCRAGGALVNPLSKANKGSLVTITGELSTELYTKKDGTTGESIKCFVSSFDYISTGNGSNNQQNTQGSNAPNNATQNNGTSGYEEVDIISDDLPF